MPFPILSGAVVAAGLLGGGELPHSKLPRLDRLPTPEQLKADVFGGQVKLLRELRDKAHEVRIDFERRTGGDYSKDIAWLKECEQIFEEQIVKFGGTVEVEKKK